MFAEAWTLGLEAHSRCKKCNFILPFNGPVAAVVCKKCGERRELDRKAWDEILDAPSKLSRIMRPGTTKDCQVGMGADALVMKATREEPSCRQCQKEFDPQRAPERCRDCNTSLAMEPAPDRIKHTQRAAQRTFLGANEGDQPGEEVLRWYIWFHVDPAEVEDDRKRAAQAIEKIESKLPKVRAWPAPAPVVAEDAPIVTSGSPYRGRAAPVALEPERELVREPKPEQSESPKISRNLVIVLVLAALCLGFFLGRSV